MKATDIIWDVDSKEVLEFLPTEIEIPAGMKEDEISDYLSNLTGFCHKAYFLAEDKVTRSEEKKDIYEALVKLLPRHPIEAKHEMWVNGNDEIMCETMDKANTLADFLEELGYDVVHVAHYDDESDGICYGCYSVYLDGM